MALIDELHHQQGADRRLRRLHLCQILLQCGELAFGLRLFVDQGSYGQGRFPQSLPQIGARFIQGDGVHRRDAGESRRRGPPAAR